MLGPLLVRKVIGKEKSEDGKNNDSNWNTTMIISTLNIPESLFVLT